MIIFFLGLVLLNSSIFCCTPPEKEGSISPVTVTSTNTNTARMRNFDPLTENVSSLPSSYFEKQKISPEMNPRRQARIEREQRQVLAQLHFEWPGNSARVVIMPVLYAYVSNIHESIYP